MQELTKIVLDYYKEKNLDINDISNTLEKVRLEVLDELLDDDKEYVIKKSGRIEEYIPDKILISIKNAAKDANIFLNASDIKIISSSILKKMQSIPRNVYPTREIKDYVIKVLKEDGYNKLAKEYIEYIG